MTDWRRVAPKVQRLKVAGHHDEALALLAPVAEGLRAGGDVAEAIEASIQEALLLGFVGQRDAALARSSWALAQVHRPEHAERLRQRDAAWSVTAAFCLFAATCTRQGGVQLDRALAALDAGVGFVERVGRPSWRAGLLAERAAVLRAQGDDEGAVAVEAEALALKRSDPATPGVHLHSMIRGHAYNLKLVGRVEEAAELLHGLLAEPDVSVLDRFAAWVYLTHNALAREQTAEAEEAVGHAIELAEQLSVPQQATALGAAFEVHKARGDWAAAREVSARHLELAEQCSVSTRVCARMDGFDAAVALGEPAAAAEHLREMERLVTQLQGRGHRTYDEDLEERKAVMEGISGG